MATVLAAACVLLVYSVQGTLATTFAIQVHVPHLLEPAEAAMQLPPPAVHAPAPECAANAVARVCTYAS